MYQSIRRALLSRVLVVAVAQEPAHAQSPAGALLQQAATAMGGVTALRALKTQIVESEGGQFDSSSTPQPLGPTRQTITFRYTLTRDLTQPRLRLQGEAQSLGSNQTIRFVETIDGSIGMLQEGAGRRGEIEGDGAKPTRLHPGRLATRLRDEQRNPARLVLTALNKKSLRHRGKAELDGKRHAVLSFTASGDEFRIYIDPETRLPQTEILEKTDAKPIASQWILRRVAGNVSYQDMGRPPDIQWLQLAPGVHKIQGSSHATILVEMRDHLIAIEAPLYEERTGPVIKSIKERFPGIARFQPVIIWTTPAGFAPLCRRAR